jgi:hypothetical protein
MKAIEAISLKNLHETTGSKPKKKSKNSKILGVKSRKNFKRFNFLVRSSEVYSDPNGHIASVIYPRIKLKDFVRDTGRQEISPYSEYVLVHCSCPAFLYWGSHFFSDTYGYHIREFGIEDRFPEIRDPKGENLVCKHLIKVAKYMEHVSFRFLNKRFRKEYERSLKERTKKRKGFRFATLQELYPVVGEFLRRNKYANDEVDEVIASLNDENVEYILEEHGLLPEIDEDKI